MISKDDIIEVLQTIIDPEVAMDIWTLGLVYEIDIQSATTVHIVITYTSPMCPAGPAIQDSIRDEMLNIGFEHVTIEVTFDPPWTMPEALKTMMGL
jgi:metal-sulfur cluster biosynthetic enzyme